MPQGPRRAGEFCWINILTPRPDEARAYFNAVLGWTYDAMPGGLGHVIHAHGQDVGAIFDVGRPDRAGDCEPCIGIMIQVPDAIAATAQARQLGGSAKAPLDLGTRARMAVCHDPLGAEFDVLEPRSFAGTEADSTLHGAPSWIECFTSDVERATAFYAGLFGWNAQPMPSHVGPYTVFQLAGAPVAGLCALSEVMPSQVPNWHTYFTVEDPDAAARLTLELGGHVTMGPRDVPSAGRMCGLVSPQGVPFRVIRYSTEAGSA